VQRTDTIGLSIAAAGHVLLVALLSLGLFHAPKPPLSKQDPIDVSLVDDAALRSATRTAAPAPMARASERGPVEQAAPAPTPQPAPQPVKPAEPPPPAPAVAPVAKPAPKPAPTVKAEPRPAPKPTKTVPPRPVQPRPAATPPVTKAQPAPAKTPAVKQQPSDKAAKGKAVPTQKAAAGKATTAKPGSGTQKTTRATGLDRSILDGIDTDSDSKAKGRPAPLGAAEARALNAEISRRLKPHWRAPTGADVDQLVTILTWRLNADGSIASGPTLVEQTGKTDSNRPQQQLHVEAAIRAVRAAAPFDLPAQYYDNWKFIERFRFDKRL
jgi:hypothetical protein